MPVLLKVPLDKNTVGLVSSNTFSHIAPLVGIIKSNYWSIQMNLFLRKHSFWSTCSIKRIPLIFVLFATLLISGRGDVTISEFMAMNSYIPYTNPLDLKTTVYGQEAHPDWIELYNSGSSAVNIGGMYLTNDKDELTKWQIPATTSIPAGGYLVIYASGKKEAEYPTNYPYVDDSGHLHTNFKIKNGGGYLALVASDGLTIVHDLGKYPSQRGLVSYGLGSGGTTNFLTEATPGAANSSTYAGEVADTKFSVKRGFYTNAFDVLLTCKTPGAQIYFTTDSSDPINTNGTAQLYDETSNVPHITTTTCLRAVATLPGWLASEIDTQTYIFVNDVLDQTRPSGYSSDWGGFPADFKMEDNPSDLKLVAGNPPQSELYPEGRVWSSTSFTKI